MAFTITGSANNHGNAATASITHGLTINSGDLVLALIHRNDSIAISVAGAGGTPWTIRHEIDGDDIGETSYMTFAEKVAGASEPATYNFSLGSASFFNVSIFVISTGGDSPSVLKSLVQAERTGTGLPVTSANGLSFVDGELSVIAAGTDFLASTSAYTTCTEGYSATGNTQGRNTAFGAKVSSGATSNATSPTFGPTTTQFEQSYNFHISYEATSSASGPEVALTRNEANHVSAVSISPVANVELSRSELNHGSAVSVGPVGNVEVSRSELNHGSAVSISISPQLTLIRSELPHSRAVTIDPLGLLAVNRVELARSQEVSLNPVLNLALSRLESNHGSSVLVASGTDVLIDREELPQLSVVSISPVVNASLARLEILGDRNVDLQASNHLIVSRGELASVSQVDLVVSDPEIVSASLNRIEQLGPRTINIEVIMAIAVDRIEAADSGSISITVIPANAILLGVSRTEQLQINNVFIAEDLPIGAIRCQDKIVKRAADTLALTINLDESISELGTPITGVEWLPSGVEIATTFQEGNNITALIEGGTAESTATVITNVQFVEYTKQFKTFIRIN